jgi:excinuclease ABC subunit A
MITALRTLRDAGNSLVLVEQNPVVLRESDWIIETGPAAGRHGGLVTFQGTPREFAQRRAGPGAAAARLGPLSEPRQPFAWLTLSGVRNRTLRDVTVRIPLGVLCAVTGVSGSGKRALVLETLVPAIRSALAGEGAAEHANSARAGHWEDLAGVQSIDAVVQIDGAQISRVKRGSLATFLGVMSDIRRRFSATPAAAARGFGPGHFSPKGAGRCQTCQGEGRVEVDMHFLPDVSMVCADCRGARFREEILQVRLRGLSIAEVLALPARDAFTYFRGATRVQRRLKPLADVGLDDLTLDQPVWALSASESSRLKLARHLGQSFRKRALFVVDEPAAGMHHVEVARLVRCFRQLLTEGHSVLIVEHNIELLNEVDYLIEMDRTPAGAAPLALGSPQALAGDPNSRIGRYLGQNGTSRQGDSSKTVRPSSC